VRLTHFMKRGCTSFSKSVTSTWVDGRVRTSGGHTSYFPLILCTFISAENHVYYHLCTPWTRWSYLLHFIPFILAFPSFCLNPTHSNNARCHPLTPACHLPHLHSPQSFPQVETRHHFSCPITATVVPLLKDSTGTPVKKGLSYKKR